MSIFRRTRYWIPLLIVLGGIISSLFAGFISPQKAAAAGETYTWKDFNTLTLAGGDTTGGPWDLKLLNSNNLPGQAERFGWTEVTVNGPKHKSGCHLTFTISVTSSVSGKINFPAPTSSGPVISDPNVRYCWSTHEECTLWVINCEQVPTYPGVRESYDGKTINLSGVRPGSGQQSETPLDKKVLITFVSPLSPTDSPKIITMSIRKNGQVVMGAGAPYNVNAGEYFASFTLEPGEYEVCHDVQQNEPPIIDCQKFTKEKFKSLTLRYGQSFDSKAIKAEISLSFSGTAIPSQYLNGTQDTQFPIPPLDTTIEKPGDTSFAKQTIATNQGTVTVDPGTATNPGNATFQVWLRSQFNNLAAGTYRVCVPKINQCKDVPKTDGRGETVTFTVDKALGTTVVASGTGLDQDEPDACTKNSKGFGWMICPMQSMFMEAALWIDKQILSLLKINACRIFNTEGSGLEDNCSTSADERASSEAFYTAWKIFRGIAFILLIIIGLIMILSEFLGWEAFNSITIRKTLPKMVAAVIVIPLLWPLLRLVTVMVNDSANAIEQLIQAPFLDLAHRVGVGDIVTGTILVISGLGAAVAGAVAFIFIGGGTVFLALVGSVVLFAGQALFVIAVRDMVFFALVIASAVAVVCGSFDPFKVVFTMWRRYIIGIWLSIPGVAAVLIICKVMAVIAQIGHSEIGIFFAVVFVVVGYAMFLPILKSIDKVSAQVDGLTDKVTSGAQKGLANFRNRQIKQNWGLFKQGALNSGFGRRFSRIGERIGAAQAVSKATGRGFRSQLFGNNDVAQQRLANYRGAVKAERAKDPIVAAGQTRAQDDTVNALIVEGLNEEQIIRRHIALHGLNGNTQAVEEANVRERVRRAEANLGGRVGQAPTRLAAWQKLQESGSAFRINEYGTWEAAEEARWRAGASLVHDGLVATTTDLAGDQKSFKRQDQRGMSFGTANAQAEASVAAYEQQLAQNGGDRTAIQAGTVLTGAQYQTLTDSAIQNVSGPAMAQERDETADRYEQRLSQRIPQLAQAVMAAPPNTPAREAAERVFFQHLAQVADFRDYQAGASRGVAAELAPLMEMQLPPGFLAALGANLPPGTPPTNEGLIRAIQSLYAAGVDLPDPFAAMRREAGKDYLQQGQGQGNVPPPPPPPFAPPPPPPPPPSDRRLKTAIKAIGSVNGIQLYSFRYIFKNGTYVGVMAQDLLHSHPSAVITDKNGFYAVNYATLGLRMCTIAEWEKHGVKAVKLPKPQRNHAVRKGGRRKEAINA